MKKLLTAALTALLLACTPDTITEDKLVGCWKAKVWENIYNMYLDIRDDHTYKIMIASHGEYSNLSGWRHPYHYCEGTWQTDGDDLLLLHSDTIVYTLYDVEVKRKDISFNLYDGYENDGIEYCEGKRYSQLKQSTINGTWSFTERDVILSVYDLVMTLDDTYNARMTFDTPNDKHGFSTVDHKEVDYTIIGPYIVFTGISPLHYFLYQGATMDGRIKYTSGNTARQLKEFQAIPQDPTAHELRLKGFIF